ncbi:MAG: NAD(P)H-dependent glycerol-3-phosphate dehydrogenase [Bacteroidales bacterium]|nr:NAD(P)H-dependent glycerol-3-phosphate dehydrogenase [Bacteroidales bacterium]
MIGLLGSGSWATAIVEILLQDTTRTLYWWVREHDIIEGLLSERHNPTYLSEVQLDTTRIHITSDLRDVVEHSDDLFLVVPSAFLADALETLPAGILQGKRLHTATKGIIPKCNQIVTDYLHFTHGIAPGHMTAISGPSHAEETARHKLTYLTVASPNRALAQKVQDYMSCSFVRTTYCNDMQGIEYGAVMKNIYAIAVGICHGLGYGDNLIAVLIANAMREMDTFVQCYVPHDGRQMMEYAYLGDLLVTCYSQFSRNRTFGNMIGHGYSVQGAQLEMNMIAEGYYAVACVEQMRQNMDLHMPIEEAVYRILYNHASAATTMNVVTQNMN